MVFITGAERPARRAGLTRVVRVNPLDPDANTLGFVCDKLLELVEMSRVDTRPRTVFVDSRSSIRMTGSSNCSASVMRRQERVIQVFDSALFFLTRLRARSALPRANRVGNDIWIERTSPHHQTPASTCPRHTHLQRGCAVHQYRHRSDGRLTRRIGVGLDVERAVTVVATIISLSEALVDVTFE